MSIIVSLFKLILKNTAQGQNRTKKDFEKGKSSDLSRLNMDSLMNDIHHSKNLYDTLKVKIHPDRFLNTDKYDLSVSLFQELTLYKRNYSKLLEIEKLAKGQLF